MFEQAGRDGMRFSCRQCSFCCSGSPGLVLLGEEDLLALTEGLGMDKDRFIETFCRSIDLGSGPFLCLKEKADYDCIFLETGACSVYDFRPIQCRTYPFWDEIVENEKTWAREATSCPGIGKGPLCKPEDILDCLVEQRKVRPILYRGGTPGDHTA